MQFFREHTHAVVVGGGYGMLMGFQVGISTSLEKAIKIGVLMGVGAYTVGLAYSDNDDQDAFYAAVIFGKMLGCALGFGFKGAIWFDDEIALESPDTMASQLNP